MRLNAGQVRLINEHIHRYFGPGSRVWLFGSRVDDGKRGGDVDLYVEAEDPDFDSELKCRIALEEELDLHVDLVVRRSGRNHPIHEIAKREGIRL